MQWTFTPSLLPLLLAAGTAAGAALLAWRRRAVPGAREFAGLMLAVAAWALAYALELAGADLPTKLAWYQVKFVAVAATPLAWLLFALHHAGRTGWLTRRRLVAVAAVPLLTALLALTNGTHGLLLRGAAMATAGPFRALALQRGPWFWVHAAVSYGLLLAGTLLLVLPLARAPALYRRQVGAVVLGAALPWAGNAASVLGLSPVPHLDLTPFAFALSGLVLLGGLLRFRLLDVVPVAHDRIVAELRDGVIVLDARGRVVEANPAARRLLGLTGRAIGRPATAVLPGAIAPSAAGEPSAGAARAIALGEGPARRDYTVAATPLADRRGARAGQLLVLRDVTASERRYRALVEHTPDAVFAFDLAGHLRSVNPAGARITGRAVAELQGLAWPALVVPAEAGRAAARFRRAVRGAVQHFETAIAHRDGRRVDLAVTLLPMVDEDRVTGVYGIAEDITARKRAEADQRFLATASALLAASLDHAATLQQVAQLAVPFLADWCFVDLAEADGPPRRVAVAHADDADAEVARGLRPGYTLDPEGAVTRVLRTGRPELYPDLSAAALSRITPDPGRQRLLAAMAPRSALIVPLVARGRTLGALSCTLTRPGRRYGPEDLALAADLAGRAALAVDNARLYREAQEAIGARDHFLAIASHELRTPATKILGHAELLLRAQARPQPDPARAERHARALMDVARHLGALTRQLLDVARLTRGQLTAHPRPVDLGALVTTAVAQHRAHLGAGHALAVEVTASGPVLADGERIAQVLANLLENAVKYSPGGGAIRVAMRPEGAGVAVTVSDQGVGLPAGAAETIFAPFGRAANVAQGTIPGLGLGLYICRDIVEQHGGRVWAASAGEGHGTTVGFWLPAASPNGSAPPPGPAAPAEQGPV